MLNDREWAFIFWAVVIAGWVFSRRDLHPSIVQVLRAGAKLKILFPLACLMGWVALEVLMATQVKLWVPSLVTTTVIWFVTSGLALFFDFNDASKKTHFFRRKAVHVLVPGALLVSLVDAFVLPLPAELVLQPTVGFLVIVAIVAGREERTLLVKKLASGLLGLIGLAILLHVAVDAVTGWEPLNKVELILQVALPVWLTLGLLPFIYAIALYSSYEMAFLRIDWKSEAGWRARLRNKIVLVTSFHFKVHELASFSGSWQLRLGKASSFREARNVVRDFRHEQREAARIDEEERERLIRFAGVDGTDEDGRRLDRREFEETADALRWLGTSLMGWFRQQDRYRADLLAVLEDDFTRQGLAVPSGIAMRVAEDGQAWYAWRRTVTGWYFAMGAAGPPPEQWEYDGPEPPKGFPGQDPSWGSGPFSGQANRNW